MWTHTGVAELSRVNPRPFSPLGLNAAVSGGAAETCAYSERFYSQESMPFTHRQLSGHSLGDLNRQGTCAASLRTPPSAGAAASLEFESRRLEIYKLSFHPIETSLVLGRSPARERTSAQLLRRRET